MPNIPNSRPAATSLRGRPPARLPAPRGRRESWLRARDRNCRELPSRCSATVCIKLSSETVTAELHPSGAAWLDRVVASDIGLDQDTLCHRWWLGTYIFRWIWPVKPSENPYDSPTSRLDNRCFLRVFGSHRRRIIRPGGKRSARAESSGNGAGAGEMEPRPPARSRSSSSRQLLIQCVAKFVSSSSSRQPELSELFDWEHRGGAVVFRFLDEDGVVMRTVRPQMEGELVAEKGGRSPRSADARFENLGTDTFDHGRLIARCPSANEGAQAMTTIHRRYFFSPCNRRTGGESRLSKPRQRARRIRPDTGTTGTSATSPQGVNVTAGQLPSQNSMLINRLYGRSQHGRPERTTVDGP